MALAALSALLATLQCTVWPRRVFLSSAGTAVVGRPAAASSSHTLRDTPDVVFPPAVLGEWVCERRVSRVEGDAAQAEAAWRLLGGRGDFLGPETFSTRFVGSPDPGRKAGVVDRGYEYAERSGIAASAVHWSSTAPDVLRARCPAGEVILAVTQRSVEPFQSEPPYGFGYMERVRVTAPATSGLGSRAVRLARRLRPDGRGGIDGSEVLATFAALDGVAALDERPTSTTTSRLRLSRRPTPASVAPSSLASAAVPPRRAAAARMAIDGTGTGTEADALLWTAALAAAAYVSGYATEGYEPHAL